jgi:hypothetical protein
VGVIVDVGVIVGVGVIDDVGVTDGIGVITGVGVTEDGEVAGSIVVLVLPEVLPVGVITGVGVVGDVAGLVLLDRWLCVSVELFPAALSFGKTKTVAETRASTSITMMTPANTSPVFLRRIGEIIFVAGAAE